MNIREQLIALREKLDGDEDNIGDVELLDKLIAERPYEPGDKVSVIGSTNDSANGKDHFFYCRHPFHEGIYILRDEDANFIPVSAAVVAPIPKTRRLKPVPMEVVESAKTALTGSLPGALDYALKSLEWLANPENLEADNE